MKLLLTRAALEDLRSIRAYTLGTWGPEQEIRYLDRIWARFVRRQLKLGADDN
jgi:plasmid stabilization system protein ParE